MEENKKQKNNLVYLLFWASFLTIILFFFLCTLFIPSGLDTQTQAKVSRAQADFRSIAVAIEAYSVDFESYPIMTPVSLDPVIVKKFPNLKIFNFMKVGNVTSPVAYLSQMPKDPFLASIGEMPYGYYLKDDLWILYSCGPDKNFDFNPESDLQYIEISRNKIRLNPYLLNKIYDPTNGNNSRGDVIRFSKMLWNE